MTRCRVCSCKLKSGDICRRCEYEQNWLNAPEYFCSRSSCQKLMPGATEPGLCPECLKTEKTEKTMSEKSKENCAVCGKKLSKNGYCFSCAMKGKRNRAKGQEDIASKAGAEKPSTILEPAADTIHASRPPAQVVKINELDVCRQAINKHGISRQLAKAAEEFSEAAAAISRFLAGEGEFAEIIGEIADVEVMCLQMRLIYGVDGIEQARAEKVARLHGRLTP